MSKEKVKIYASKEGLELQDNQLINSGFIVRLDPKEAYQLIHQIIDALAEWHKLTGKAIDDPKCF